MMTYHAATPMCDEMLSAKDIQRKFNVSRSTAYRVIQSGQLRIVRIGRSVRVSHRELLRLIRTNGGELPTSSSSETTVRH